MSFHVAFRADASPTMGIGHVMRCSALGDQFRSMGAEVTFLSRSCPAALRERLADTGFNYVDLDSVSGKRTLDTHGDASQTVRVLSTDPAPDWIVVDHYDLDQEWQTAARTLGSRIAVIDDLAVRCHDCDVLIDVTYGREPEDYRGLTPPEATLLLGPKYALLSRDFHSARSEALSRRAETVKPKAILVSFGGSDPSNTTAAVLHALEAWHSIRDHEVTVVLGPENPRSEGIHRLAAALGPASVIPDARNMATLMTTADLAIGGGGTTSWERCCVGLPTAIISLAANQDEIARALHDAGAAVFLGNAPDLADTPRLLHDALDELVGNPSAWQRMAQRASEVTDGLGAVRVAETLLTLLPTRTHR